MAFLKDVTVPPIATWGKASKLTQQIYLERRDLVVQENGLQPNPVYPHDTELVERQPMEIQQQAIIAMMQVYRQVKKLGR